MSTLDSDAVRHAHDVLSGARHVLVFTGAGISAESGLPTYRGTDGLWSRVDSRRLTSPRAFERDPRTVWRFSDAARRMIARSTASQAHLALAEFALRRADVTISTQNVDGLHTLAAEQAAGARDAGPARPAEIHGCLWRLRCLDCGHRYEHRATIDADQPPLCPHCSGRVRPDIVWFGEPLDRQAYQRTLDAADAADVCLVIGTSGTVPPASAVPGRAVERGARLIEINPEATPFSTQAEVSLRCGANDGLAQIL